jgi:RNA recognition motif-containing protein
MNIYVGNLSYDCSEQELRTAFSTYGVVDSARLITDRDTGRPKGFGFVEMSNNNEAMAAIQALNNSTLKDRTITVNEARPREERPARSSYGGGGGGGRRW